MPPAGGESGEAVAAGVTRLHGQAARVEHDLPTSSSISKAVGVLRDDGHLGYADPPRLADPFFRHWILRHAMPDARPAS